MPAFGIAYRVTCQATGKSYIGITTRTLRRRWQAHLLAAQSSERRGATALVGAIRKYGNGAFLIEPIASASTPGDLLELEVLLIAQERIISPSGYNLNRGGNGSLDPTEETKARLRAAHVGRKQSPELIERRVAPLRGRKRPRHLVEQAAAKQRGVKRPGTGVVGRVMSAEARAKMRASHLGVKLSPAHVAKMIGRKRSEESRRKQRLAMRGKRFPNRKKRVAPVNPRQLTLPI